MERELKKIAETYPELEAWVGGRGMIYGLELPERGLASQVSERCFENGLIIELAGSYDQVVKFLPALTIDEETLLRGIEKKVMCLCVILRHAKSVPIHEAHRCLSTGIPLFDQRL